MLGLHVGSESLMKCPYCKKEIDRKQIASEIGKHNSEAKRQAARVNGRKGGRPKKALKQEETK